MIKRLIPYVVRIINVARKARSESKLEGEINQILRESLEEYGITFDPFVNVSLKRLGFSQVNSDRPDGVFGHIVYDYKVPGSLKKPTEVRKAKLQLQKYLDIVTNGGHSINSDECIKWFGYVMDGFTFLYCQSNGIEWIWSHSIKLSENSLFFLIKIYRSLRKKPLSSFLLSQAFGRDSDVARETIRVFAAHLSKPKHKTKMLFREWKRLFEQVSTYELDQLASLKAWAIELGIATKEAAQILFAIHTYYSIVVKILTTELLSASSLKEDSLSVSIATAPNDEQMKSLLENLENSEYYKKFRITNFLEGDFFSWYLDEKSKSLFQSIRIIAQHFLDFEPASALLRPENKKDLLKEFYSSLVDEEIRHDLGEYYTPDWLAQHIIDKIGFKGNSSDTIIDPACGSGTFLVECIDRIRKKNVNKPSLDILKIILNNVKGLDLNPLAVISARANYILSIYDLVFGLGYDIEIPVYLADSINVPMEKTYENGEQVLEYLLDTELEQFTLRIPLSLVRSQVLGQILLKCEDVIAAGKNRNYFIRQLHNNKSIAPHLTSSVIARIEDFFDQIYSLENRDWNKIWCRIIKNNFSSRGFDPFLFIVGNPPWVRWSRLPQSYRNRVKAFCKYYGLVSGRGYSGGIESDISTVITFSAVDNWLAKDGIICFLITWSVFKSASARGFRLGYLPEGNGLRILDLEDLTSLQPFPDATNATSIYMAKKVNNQKNVPFTSVPCSIWKPKRGFSRVDPALSLKSVKSSVKILEGSACPISEWGSPLFTGDKYNFNQSAFLRGSSEYLRLAHRGTVSDAARIYWVKVDRFSPETNRALIRTLNNDELSQAQQVSHVKGAWIEADLLHPLIRGRDLGRYSVKTEGWYQLIPNEHYEDVLKEDEFSDSFPLTYSYLMSYKNILQNRSSYKRYQSHLPPYVIYCIGEYSFLPYKVIWMEQQNPEKFRASVIGLAIESDLPNRIIIPDHKLYFVGLSSEQEAHYLCGFLNSRPVRTWLGGFLLNKQIGTSIFEYMKVPIFASSNSTHLRIAKISQVGHSQRIGSINIDELSEEIEVELSECVKSICSSVNSIK